MSSAYFSKNFSFISTLSPHLRKILSRKLSLSLSICPFIDQAVVMVHDRSSHVFSKMPAVCVIRGARAFGGNHGRAERMLGSALLSKRRTIVRFLHAFEHQAADANLRLLCVDFFGLENSVGIVIAKFIAQFVAAFWNRTDAAPFAVAHFENFIHQILRDAVSVALNDSRILVFHLVRSGFELAHSHQNAFAECRSARIR